VTPMQIDGRTVHQISVPWHWGNFTTSPLGVTGDTANDLVALSGDPNVSIEDKTFACQVRAGRRERPSTARLAGVRDPGLHPSGDHAAEQPDSAGQSAAAAHEPPPEP
jgi:formate dehydrogenase major subunit